MNKYAQPSTDPVPQPLGLRLLALAAAAHRLAASALRRRAAGPVLMAGRNDGPPDLDELWRDFNKKLSGLFNGKGGGNNPTPPREPGGGGPSFQPDMKSAGPAGA